MNKALDKVRAEETGRMKREGRDPVLRSSLAAAQTQRESPDDSISASAISSANLKTVRAYLLKEAFQQLWDYNSPVWAGKFLDEWCRQTMRSRIEPMKKIARSLRTHRELILNYFRAQKLLSSGVVEGLNNKAKVTMRKSYGFRTYRVLELALYHSLGKLPEPESTTISLTNQKYYELIDATRGLQPAYVPSGLRAEPKGVAARTARWPAVRTGASARPGSGAADTSDCPSDTLYRLCRTLVGVVGDVENSDRNCSLMLSWIGNVIAGRDPLLPARRAKRVAPGFVGTGGRRGEDIAGEVLLHHLSFRLLDGRPGNVRPERGRAPPITRQAAVVVRR
jgi:hypothetical protein